MKDATGDCEALGSLASAVPPRVVSNPLLGRARLVEAVAQARTRRSHRRHWAVGFATAAALAVIVVIVALRPRPLTYAAAGVPAPPGAHAAQSEQLAFSDGSLVTLGAGATARVAATDADGARVVLERGQVKLEITPNQRSSWAVAAGPYEVSVIGTSFSVSWNGASYELAVSRGSVRVHGPLVEQGLVVASDHVFTTDVRSGRFELRSATRPPEPAVDLDLSAETFEVRDPAAGDGALKNAPRVAPAPVSWSDLVRRGDYAAVLEAAEARGVDASVEASSAADLEALATAARYKGRRALAERALLAQRRRFAGSSGARTAAYLLGMMSEGANAGAAIGWYERYLAEAPGGPLASEALGRKLRLLSRAPGPAATSAARDYLRRFPNGAHAKVARQVLGETEPGERPE
jgi:hypothetical protein